MRTTNFAGLSTRAILRRRKLSLLAWYPPIKSMQTDEDPNFDNAIKHLEDWLMQCGCIERVTRSSGLLKSYPPQKLLMLTTKSPGAGRIFHLKLRLGNQMEIDAFEG